MSIDTDEFTKKLMEFMESVGQPEDYDDDRYDAETEEEQD